MPMNMHRPDRVEDPDRWLRNTAEKRISGSQPAKDQSHDQCAAARRQRQRYAPDDNGEQADKTAQEDADADKDHVGRRRVPVRIAQSLAARSTSTTVP